MSLLYSLIYLINRASYILSSQLPVDPSAESQVPGGLRRFDIEGFSREFTLTRRVQ